MTFDQVSPLKRIHHLSTIESFRFEDEDAYEYLIVSAGTLSKDDDDGSENVDKKMNLRSFKLNRVYLDPLNMSNAGDFSWS